MRLVVSAIGEVVHFEIQMHGRRAREAKVGVGDNVEIRAGRHIDVIIGRHAVGQEQVRDDRRTS